MELAAEKPGMVGRLDDFDVILVRSPARDAQAGAGEDFLVVAVELVAMPVPLVNFELAVGAMRERAQLELASPGAEAHGAAHLVDAQQLAQLIDHAMRRLRIEFRAIGLLEFGDVASVFNGRALHAQADPEERNLMLAGVANGVDHPGNAALSEPPRDQNPAVLAQSGGSGFRRIDLFGFDPLQNGL